MGHVTALANKLTAVADERPGVAEALEGSPQWRAWREGVLAPRNACEDVNRWACGRPSTQEMASRAASADDPMMQVGGSLSFPCVCWILPNANMGC